MIEKGRSVWLTPSSACHGFKPLNSIYATDAFVNKELMWKENKHEEWTHICIAYSMECER